jgi:hypothetical protein
VILKAAFLKDAWSEIFGILQQQKTHYRVGFL